jgi:benzodiazapine receptor
MISKIKKYSPEIIGGLLCLSLGMLSGYSMTAADFAWYHSLNKPFFNPPSWIFGPVWTVLYLMMGVGLGILWKNKFKNKLLIIIFIAQLIFNLIWSPIFFYYQRIDLALLDIFALWISLVLFMFAARKQSVLLALFLPYLLWVSFALVLNFSIYKLNII